MALIGSAPALRCPCGGTLLVGKDVPRAFIASFHGVVL
jgi:hypothetical protein